MSRLLRAILGLEVTSLAWAGALRLSSPSTSTGSGSGCPTHVTGASAVGWVGIVLIRLGVLTAALVAFGRFTPIWATAAAFLQVLVLVIVGRAVGSGDWFSAAAVALLLAVVGTVVGTVQWRSPYGRRTK
jgi:hypothetical protein